MLGTFAQHVLSALWTAAFLAWHAGCVRLPLAAVYAYTVTSRTRALRVFVHDRSSFHAQAFALDQRACGFASGAGDDASERGAAHAHGGCGFVVVFPFNIGEAQRLHFIHAQRDEFEQGGGNARGLEDAMLKRACDTSWTMGSTGLSLLHAAI